MVSVIIPTYRRADYIERAIDSVLNQSYKDISVIVVDDNDTNTEYRHQMENVMEKYSNNNRVIYIKHDKNKNGAAARNTGIRTAKGEYITFLDDDDFFLKDRIKSLVTILNSNREYDGVYTNVVKIKNNKIRNIIYAKKSGNLQYDSLMQNTFLGTGSNIFLRKKVIDKIKGFDEDFFRYQDIEFMVRFFRKFKILAVNNFSVVKDDNSRINGSNAKRNYEMLELFFKKFDKDIKKYDNYNAIYYANYNKMYNNTSDILIKSLIKKRMSDKGFNIKISFKQLFLNKFKLTRNIFSVLRGALLKRKLPQSIKEEIYSIIKEGKKI